MNLHLVIPCYRESSRISDFLPILCAEMEMLGGISVQVVEDGSGIEEQKLMQQMHTEWSKQFACLMKPLMLLENRGKGGAVYAGWAQAEQMADCLGFVDADGSCSAAEVARLAQMMKKNNEHALFASRVKMLGRRVDRLLKRHLLGRIFATLVSELLHIPVYDSQCGLKLVPRAAYEKIAASLQVTGFAFDVELMVSLLDSGCVIEEVPIDWQETPNGKVNLFCDSWRMAWDVWKIRKRRSGIEK